MRLFEVCHLILSAFATCRPFEASNRYMITDHRTAKWTAITDRLAGTHRHTGALSPQAGAADALAGGLPDLHGMQEARGSSPLSSTLSSTRQAAYTQWPHAGRTAQGPVYFDHKTGTKCRDSRYHRNCEGRWSASLIRLTLPQYPGRGPATGGVWVVT